MALDVQITGNLDQVGNVKTALTLDPQYIGGVRLFSQNDSGAVTGKPSLLSPEVDADFRFRVSQDLILDDESFNYTAQNTGKHNYIATNLVNAWTAGNLTTNSSSITTVNSGSVFATYAAFPNNGTQTLSADVELAFSNQPVSNTIIEFGLGIPGSQLVAPLDGVFMRLTSAGLIGVASNNGTETPIAFPLSNGTGVWAYTPEKKYQFIIYQGMVKASFWVNDGVSTTLLGEIPLPSGQGRMTMGQGLQFFIKHRIVGGAAGGILQAKVGAYNVRLGGSNLTSTISTQGNRIYGSYQGISGGTMGSLSTYPNSANPTAAAPSNTALTANLPSGLGGQGAVIAAAAAATDGIWSSYQVPPVAVNSGSRRLVIRGVQLDLLNLGAAVATTATSIQFSLAYGHTAVSLATTDGAASKSPRRLPLGYATWAVGAAIGTQPQGGKLTLDLGDAPVFVNPGEFVALVGKFLVGTATASQVINFTWTPIYGWE